jgi:hypothetical protein
LAAGDDLHLCVAVNPYWVEGSVDSGMNQRPCLDESQPSECEVLH